MTSYQNIYSNISFPKAVNKTCPCGVTTFTSHHKVITSSRSLQTRLLHQGVSMLLRHVDVDQSQTVSKSADFRCEKMHFCSSESRESRIFGISALKTIVLRNKMNLFSTCNWSIEVTRGQKDQMFPNIGNFRRNPTIVPLSRTARTKNRVPYDRPRMGLAIRLFKMRFMSRLCPAECRGHNS